LGAARKRSAYTASSAHAIGIRTTRARFTG
jgi:hypothetical protein